MTAVVSLFGVGWKTARQRQVPQMAAKMNAWVMVEVKMRMGIMMLVNAWVMVMIRMRMRMQMWMMKVVAMMRKIVMRGKCLS